jgi:hypothetical protein
MDTRGDHRGPAHSDTKLPRQGRDVLRSLHEDELTTYDIPDVVPNRTAITHSQPPLDTDKYVSTPSFSRSPLLDVLPHLTFLDSTSQQTNATQGTLPTSPATAPVLVLDLLTIEDRRAFGWPLMLTDVLGLVEQALLAQSSFFYANAFSSYAGV